MPETRTYQIYKFDELSERAKERARDWYREGIDSNDFDTTISDAVECGERLGITFDTHEVGLYGGKKRMGPNLWWELGYSQSDGVSFDGCYKFADPQKIREHAPVDGVLHGIADRLYEIQKLYAFKLTARISARSQSWLTTDVEFDDPEDLPAAVEKQIEAEMEAFCQWVYKHLRAEDEYLRSEEFVDESIEINEYTFTEDGKRAD